MFRVKEYQQSTDQEMAMSMRNRLHLLTLLLLSSHAHFVLTHFTDIDQACSLLTLVNAVDLHKGSVNFGTTSIIEPCINIVLQDFSNKY